jgi:hypothetical protein
MFFLSFSKSLNGQFVVGFLKALQALPKAALSFEIGLQLKKIFFFASNDPLGFVTSCMSEPVTLLFLNAVCMPFKTVVI